MDRDSTRRPTAYGVPEPLIYDPDPFVAEYSRRRGFILMLRRMNASGIVAGQFAPHRLAAAETEFLAMYGEVVG